MEINWNIFNVKFDGKESKTFELLAYNLFCFEHDMQKGIFRFKHQIGIETEPIIHDDKSIGFQAKFYDTNISQNKRDIIDSIQKAKKKNDGLDLIYFYLNKEFSESSKKDIKDPSYKIEIESAAAKIGIKIQWRVPSNIEIIVANPNNQHILSYFFKLDKSIIDFLRNLDEHTRSLLSPIKTRLDFNDVSIKIDRDDEVQLLLNSIQKNESLIIHGPGGVGKTALLKQTISQLENIPVYAFKGAEFNVQSTHYFFAPFGIWSLKDIIQAHEYEPHKIFIIDSAEKLSEIENQEPFGEIISELILNNWSIIFTTRNIYCVIS